MPFVRSSQPLLLPTLQYQTFSNRPSTQSARMDLKSTPRSFSPIIVRNHSPINRNPPQQMKTPSHQVNHHHQVKNPNQIKTPRNTQQPLNSDYDFQNHQKSIYFGNEKAARDDINPRSYAYLGEP